MTNFEKVYDLHIQKEIPLPEKPTMPPTDILDFRLEFLQEELTEIQEAILHEDLTALADGLADLVYVALGTAALAGIPFDDVFDIVHQANLTKVRGPAKQTKRGHMYDLIKPPHFIHPENKIRELLRSRL